MHYPRPLKIHITLLAALSLLYTAFFHDARAAEPLVFSAVVDKVRDGDTVTLQSGLKVRLLGIDAPELKQAGGPQARLALSDCLHTREVVVEQYGRDRYQRALAMLRPKGSEESCNLALVALGRAWFYRQYASKLPKPERQRFDRAELDAQAGAYGLWADPAPVAPWAWRKLH